MVARVREMLAGPASAALVLLMLAGCLGLWVGVPLGWLNRWHAGLLERRDRQPTSSALEVILVSSAGIAVVGFAIWFFGFAGASPVPLNIGF